LKKCKTFVIFLLVVSEALLKFQSFSELARKAPRPKLQQTVAALRKDGEAGKVFIETMQSYGVGKQV